MPELCSKLAYYPGIMLNALACLLCLKLYRHNRCRPSSELLTGRDTVGTRPTLPIKGIPLILRNYLAGSNVMPDLQLVSNPTTTMG